MKFTEFFKKIFSLFPVTRKMKPPPPAPHNLPPNAPALIAFSKSEFIFDDEIF